MRGKGEGSEMMCERRIREVGWGEVGGREKCGVGKRGLSTVRIDIGDLK